MAGSHEGSLLEVLFGRTAAEPILRTLSAGEPPDNSELERRCHQAAYLLGLPPGWPALARSQGIFKVLAETRGTGIPAARANLFYTHCAGCFGGELGCSGAELRAPETAVECALRDSLKVHPEFFRQKVRVVHETAELVVVDKPFDTQIGAGAGQRPRWPGEITVEETIRGRGNAVAPHRVHEEPPPPSSRRVRPGKQPPPPKKRGTVHFPKRCHNLDFATSGLLVLAKSQAGLRAASSAFEPGSSGVIKEYLAVVIGWPSWEHCLINSLISPDPTHQFKMRVTEAELLPRRIFSQDARGDGTQQPTVSFTVDPLLNGQQQPGDPRRSPPLVDPAVAAVWGPSRLPPAPIPRDPTSTANKARPAVTEAWVVRRGWNRLPGPLHGKKVAVVRLRPRTGRRHQLRVHLAYVAGHPILGDVCYAGDIHTYRLCLHASKLQFVQQAVEARPGTECTAITVLPAGTMDAGDPFNDIADAPGQHDAGSTRS